MRFISYNQDGHEGLAVETPDGLRGFDARSPEYRGSLHDALTRGAQLEDLAQHLAQGRVLAPETFAYLPPISRPGKILCVGLNYADHAAETGKSTTDYPTFFLRVATTLVGHKSPLLRPRLSEQLDFEGEIAAIIGRRAKDLSANDALDAVAGYALFNDASIRDYQRRTTQFTPGKNFDSTGAFGPGFVPANILPPGCKGLRLTTRLNGALVQNASTDDMISPISQIVSLASQFMTLEPGDVIVTGTPSGVGMGRTPPLWMKPGDEIEVEVEGLGRLINPVAQG